MKRLLVMSTLAVLAGPVMAHTGAEHSNGMMAGLAHPLGGLDHILAMVAVGVLAMQLGGRALWALPASFIGMMLVGGALGMTGVALPAMELGILGSVLVLGVVIALGRQISLRAAAPLVGFFAVFHGFAHGAEMPMAMSGLEYALGFAAATAVLHGAGVLMALGSKKVAAEMAPMVLRLIGAATAVMGLGLLAA